MRHKGILFLPASASIITFLVASLWVACLHAADPLWGARVRLLRVRKWRSNDSDRLQACHVLMEMHVPFFLP